MAGGEGVKKIWNRVSEGARSCLATDMFFLCGACVVKCALYFDRWRKRVWFVVNDIVDITLKTKKQQVHTHTHKSGGGSGSEKHLLA